MKRVIIMLDLTKMSKTVRDPKALFNHVFGLTKNYSTTSRVMRTKYGIGVRVEARN